MVSCTFKILFTNFQVQKVDFSDGDINVPNNVMVMEMGAMGRGYEFARQPLQTVPGRETPHDISNLAWGQVRRAKARYFLFDSFPFLKTLLFSKICNSSAFIVCAFQVVNGDGITNGGTLVSMK